MALKIANNATALVGSSITAEATQVTLAAGAGAKFPTLSTGDWFPITVVKATDASQLEIMRVTARSGDVLTVVRAQEGTSAKEFAPGDVVEMRLTAGAISEGLPMVDGTTGGKRLRFSVSGLAEDVTRNIVVPNQDVDLTPGQTFPPVNHSHSWNQVTGKPAQATRWPSWSEVTSKPSTFPPSSHSHSWSSITGKPATTGSGNMVLAHGPRFTGQPTISAADQYVAWHNVDHSFTGTLTGLTTTVRPTVQARRIGPGALVILHILEDAIGVSNSTTMTLSGIPAGFAPGSGLVRVVTCAVINAGVPLIGLASIAPNGVITFRLSGDSPFAGTGSKGLPAGWTVVYYT